MQPLYVPLRHLVVEQQSWFLSFFWMWWASAKLILKFAQNQISPASKSRKIIAELSSMCNWANILKTVVNFWRNLLIYLVMLPQYNYQKILVPPIRLLKIWQEIILRIYFNRWSVDSVKKNGVVRSREKNCSGSRGLLVQICIVKIFFGKGKK